MTGSARSVRAAIGGLVGDRGLTAVVVTHDPETAALADRTIGLRDGRVCTDGDGALVISADGWVNLPASLRQSAGIDTRAEVVVDGGRLVLAPGRVRAERTPWPGLCRAW